MYQCWLLHDCKDSRLVVLFQDEAFDFLPVQTLYAYIASQNLICLRHHEPICKLSSPRNVSHVMCGVQIMMVTVAVCLIMMHQTAAQPQTSKRKVGCCSYNGALIWNFASFCFCVGVPGFI